MNGARTFTCGFVPVFACFPCECVIVHHPQVDRNELQSRTYDYTGELECDKNTEITLKAIEAAKDSKGFAAVKVGFPLVFHPSIAMCFD